MSTISLQIKERINEICTHFLFEYNGKNCGVDPISREHFEMWCGEDFHIAKSIDEVMSATLFEGNSLTEIADAIYDIEW